MKHVHLMYNLEVSLSWGEVLEGNDEGAFWRDCPSSQMKQKTDGNCLDWRGRKEEGGLK